MKKFERKEILNSFRKFIDISQDLLNCNFGSFEMRLAIFVDFCENDMIMSFITKQLKGYDYGIWKSEFDKSVTATKADFKLPINENDRISLLYQILLKANTKEFDIPYFCIMIFASGNSLTDCIRDFNNDITKPLIRDISYKLEEIKDDIRDSNVQQISQERLIVVNTGNIANSQVAIGIDIKQIKISDMNLDNFVNKLIDTIVKDNSLEHNCKQDLLSDVQSMKIEMQKNKPNNKKIMEYLENFVTISGIAEISQKIIEYISLHNLF